MQLSPTINWRPLRKVAADFRRLAILPGMPLVDVICGKSVKASVMSLLSLQLTSSVTTSVLGGKNSPCIFKENFTGSCCQHRFLVRTWASRLLSIDKNVMWHLRHFVVKFVTACVRLTSNKLWWRQQVLGSAITLSSLMAISDDLLLTMVGFQKKNTPL